jgi:outer membrane protein OmpA-like peptidoglycan-associated protein
MADDDNDLEGGVSGAHPVPETQAILVAPTTEVAVNTIRPPIIPVACWKIEDLRFEFASSFVRPEARKELQKLSTLVGEHPLAPLSIFGHADPIGTDDPNKRLSGRRAQAIYALLIRDTALWEEIFNDSDEHWGLKSIQIMLRTLGHEPGTISGAQTGSTTSAVKAFQSANGLTDDGDPGPKTRAKLFKAYMDAICVDAAAAPFQLQKSDFLTQGADPKGKGDYQGCSEFNPVVMFSQSEAKAFEPQAKHAQRNAENAPNRRVMVLLFRPGSVVTPDRWPCPRATEGTAACKKRFWSDADTRRQFQAERRTFEDTKDTFACRFYHRLTLVSPCERAAPPLPLAFLEIILDQDRDTVVDEASPVAEFVRFGVWDQAYDASINVRNGAAENANFIGQSWRRFYFRVRDPLASGPRVDIQWKTLKADKSDDDVPASLILTLTETKPGSKVFVSKAVMLVTDDTDRDQPTDSGLAAPAPDVGVRNRGQSNHRLRRARIDGLVHGEYQPATGPLVKVELPIFKRAPDERRRVPVRVINYGSNATAAYIAGQFQHANDRWNQVGIQIDAGAATARPVPAGATNAAGLYNGSADNPSEVAAMADLIPITPDGTLTVVFVSMTGANAYATVAQRNNSALQDRFFIFINTNLALNGDTLAHELHHVLFNRFDTATTQQFFTFNTNPSNSFGIPLPDVRVRRRIQHLNAPDPDNDPGNNNILNWARRARTARFPIGAGNGPATSTTGNTLTTAF